MATEVCGYRYTGEDEDEWLSPAAECGRDPNHEGRHRLVLEWDTAPSDICDKLGHEWGDWAAIEKPTHSDPPDALDRAQAQLEPGSEAFPDVTVDGYLTRLSAAYSPDFVGDSVLPPGPGWKVEPTRERCCARCKQRETDGVLNEVSTRYLLYGEHAFPKVMS